MFEVNKLFNFMFGLQGWAQNELKKKVMHARLALNRDINKFPRGPQIEFLSYC